MAFKLRNCTQCKQVLRPNDETLCNKHLMEVIRSRRPSFCSERTNYPELIRANYEQDPDTKVWTKRRITSLVRNAWCARECPTAISI